MAKAEVPSFFYESQSAFLLVTKRNAISQLTLKNLIPFNLKKIIISTENDYNGLITCIT